MDILCGSRRGSSLVYRACQYYPHDAMGIGWMGDPRSIASVYSSRGDSQTEAIVIDGIATKNLQKYVSMIYFS